MYQNILVAIDNSNHTPKIVDNAIKTALAYHSKITLCHIKQETIIYNPIESSLDPTGMMMVPPIITQDFSDSMDDVLEKIKQEILNAQVKEVEIVQTFSAAPGLTIAENIVPENHIDLIICGASNKSTFDRFLLGSVTSEIIQHTTCDIKLVHLPKD